MTSENRGSPRTTLITSISPEDKQNCFGDGDDVILDRAPLSPMGDIIKDNTQEAMISASSDPTALEGPVFSEYTAPSVGDSSVPDSRGRKPDGDTVADTSRSAGTDYNTSMEACTFKKGGMCRIHLLKGTKKTIKWSEWSQKKNGLFGYVSRQKTEYVCHFSGGASSNCGHLETKSHFDGVAESNSSISGIGMMGTQTTALGGNTCNKDNTSFQGISGEGNYWTGCFKSEMKKISDIQDQSMN